MNYRDVSEKTIEAVSDLSESAVVMQGNLTASSLGEPSFRLDHHTNYSYVVGSMYRGISSVEMVVRLARAGILGFFGSGGLRLTQVEDAIFHIQQQLSDSQPYGINLLRDEAHPQHEEDMVTLLLRKGVTRIEASAFMYITAPLVRFRAAGLCRDRFGSVVATNLIMAKLSRPEVAQAFLSPAPDNIVRALLDRKAISNEQAEMLAIVPMADDICVETDSGGHTDGSAAYAVFPTIGRMRDRAMASFAYKKMIRIGAAGGIGTPEAAAAAFLMGADFILTGSINQCTIEAGTSIEVKDILQSADIQDTVYAPAGDLFETGAKVQVLKRGLLFPARANRLYALYCQFNSLDELDSNTCNEIEERYLRCGFDEVYNDIKTHYSKEIIKQVDCNPKQKMAMIFRWYLRLSTRVAIEGHTDRRVDYQIHCGPAMGAFNQWVKGTQLESWHNRHVDELARILLQEAANFLNRRISLFTSTTMEG